MRRLRLPTKLGVLSSVLVVPLLVICVLLVQRLGEDIRLAENEADGVRVISLMADVVQSVQTHRGRRTCCCRATPLCAAHSTRPAAN
ncbi:hypothetical protein Y695_01960 [Hydrogenophaga sp. T4]|nr:hypothetical protein Y695_01960 [Hydrogenophaga sp. T4]